MSSKTCLVVLIGLPGAGKTNFTELIRKSPRADFYNLFIVRYDDLMDDERFRDVSYREFRKKVSKYVGILTENVSDRKSFDPFCDVSYRDRSYPNLIILDDNFFYYSMRYEIYRLAGNHNSSFVEVYFDCDRDASVAGNSKRPSDHRVSNRTIFDMNRKLEKPDSSKNSWESHTVTINSTDDDPTKLSKAFGTIEGSLDCPVKKSNFVKREVTHSLIHTVDISLRKKINRTIKEAVRTFPDTETRDRKISQIRKLKDDFLDEVRTGKVVLHQHDVETQLEMLFDSNCLS